MNKQDIIRFFDNCAPQWDADMIRNEEVVSTILTLGGIDPGIDVLDVACGTGVLFPDYLARRVNSVTAIDISPEMAKIAQSKFPQVKVLCGDVETTKFDRQFDAVMVYNAFPHFPDPAALIKVLAACTKPGGRLSVAHGMSRAALTDHHAGRASTVSVELLHEKELAALFAPYFDVDVVISTDRMYQVSGVRRAEQPHSHGGYVHTHGNGGHIHSHFTEQPMDELLALLKYTLQHNDAHAQELAELADRLRQAGRGDAYGRVMDAVADFDMVNGKLGAVLTALSADTEA